MKNIIAVPLLSLFLAVPVFAAESNQPVMPENMPFEQKQANIIKMLDQRIAHIQEGKACVQAAKNNSDLNACREKHQAKMQETQQGMSSQPGMMGVPKKGPMAPTGC